MVFWRLAKLVSVIISAASIGVGLVLPEPALAIGGATVHVIVGVFELFGAYRAAKLLRAGICAPDERKSTIGTLANWVENGITLTGLFLAIASSRGDAKEFGVAGWMIWGGAIVCYFLSGIIAREVGGIPLSMGYGGWKVRRDKRGRIIH